MDWYMKGTGILVVSRRGVNFKFWSHLKCSARTPSYMYVAVKVSKKYKNVYLYVSNKLWSLLGAQIGLL